MFCHDNPYSYAKNAVQTCPSWQSYAFEGSTVNSGGQSGVLGPSTRIYLAMRWDLVDCTNNDWWSVNNEQDSPAGKYLDGPTLYDDCVAGFNAALGGCKSLRSCFFDQALTKVKAKPLVIRMGQKTRTNAWSTSCFPRPRRTWSCLVTIFLGKGLMLFNKFKNGLNRYDAYLLHRKIRKALALALALASALLGFEVVYPGGQLCALYLALE